MTPTGLLTPSQVIDELAAAYFDKLTEGVAVPCWDDLPDFRKERHRRAVRSLLLRQFELSEPPRQVNQGAPFVWTSAGDVKRAG